MSGSLTVIGGHSGSTLTGLVTIPTDQTPLTLAGFQVDLTNLSNAVLAGTEQINNLAIGASTTASLGAAGIPTILEITDIDSTGASIAGTSATFTTTVPSGYNALVVQLPGAETITGNGSSDFLAVFGSQSSVNFNANNSGTGTVVASANNFIQVGGTFGAGAGWSVIGGATGADTINTTAENTSITTQGSGNIVGLAGIFATVTGNGSNDIIASFGGSNTISIAGANDAVLLQGVAADTVYANAGSTGTDVFFFGRAGGATLDFINNSTVAASVTGGSDGSSGSVTVFAGVGGGYYQGGTNGNNSLVGSSGSAATTLIGAGTNNFLSVDGSGSNALFAADGNLETLVAGSGTQDNLLQAGSGQDSLISFGSGKQDFFAGTGTETLTGSSVSSALNSYYFNQASTQGGGTAYITDFRYGTDKGYINPFVSTGGGVSISGIQNEQINGQASSQINLSDNTKIELVGVTFTTAQAATIVGGTTF